MRLYSTRESTNNGEVTWLALVETTLAVTLLVILSVWFNTAGWIALAVCLAPLTLLGADESIERSARWYRGGGRWFEIVGGIGFVTFFLFLITVAKNAPWPVILAVVTLGIPISVAVGFCGSFLLVRCAATFATLLRHPWITLGSVSPNWQRVVLATDSATVPDFLPGVNYGPLELWRGVSEDTSFVWRAFWGIIFPLVYFFTASYHWSVKATSIVYLPLIWIVKKGQFDPPNLRDALDDHQVGKVRLVISILLLSLFVGKLVAMVALQGFADWWNTTEGLKRLRVLIVPHQVPVWQIASALNCVLAIWLWRYAWKKVRQFGRANPPDERKVLTVWRAVTLISAVLSLYTIACTFAIVVKAGLVWPTLRALWESMGREVWPG